MATFWKSAHVANEHLNFWKFPLFGRSIKEKVRLYPPSSAKLWRYFRISGDLLTKVRTIDLFTEYFVQ